MARFNFITRGLQTLFPSSGTEMHSPALLREEVALVHPYPGKARAFDAIDRIVADTPNDLTPTGTIVTAGPDEWVEVLHADTFHDSATARRILIRMRLSTGFTLEVARFDALVASVAFGEPWFSVPVGVTARLLPQRPLYLPPGALLTHTGDTAAAAYIVSTVAAVVRHALPEQALLV